ncbi:hypothetical protein BT63DRAFT_458501 [Microthyrium microscopicum]|uniref:Glycine zipper 2TM domain-containing protein n=1 Tax=Microthyrium microscopicum TaxID=703497 RepID=A0A6A6U4S4_9PEZI|nr:hypothetical protein BT63DRAFT_458501 [Microthyrium microscopicum]
MHLASLLTFAAVAVALPQRGGRGGGFRGGGFGGPGFGGPGFGGPGLGGLIGNAAGGFLGGLANAQGNLLGSLIGNGASIAGEIGAGIADGINDALWGWRRTVDGVEVWVPPPADVPAEKVIESLGRHAAPLPEVTEKTE